MDPVGKFLTAAPQRSPSTGARGAKLEAGVASVLAASVVLSAVPFSTFWDVVAAPALATSLQVVHPPQPLGSQQLNLVALPIQPFVPELYPLPHADLVPVPIPPRLLGLFQTMLSHFLPPVVFAVPFLIVTASAASPIPAAAPAVAPSGHLVASLGIAASAAIAPRLAETAIPPKAPTAPHDPLETPSAIRMGMDEKSGGDRGSMMIRHGQSPPGVGEEGGWGQ